MPIASYPQDLADLDASFSRAEDKSMAVHDNACTPGMLPAEYFWRQKENPGTAAPSRREHPCCKMGPTAEESRLTLMHASTCNKVPTDQLTTTSIRPDAVLGCEEGISKCHCQTALAANF